MTITRRWAFLLIAGAALVAASCREPTLPAAPSQASAPQTSLIGSILQATGLVSCTPQPYDSASSVIGPLGGTISVGGNRLAIPPGALDHQVLITAVVRPQRVNEVEFGPQGLRFEQAARLTMSYANCSLLGRLLPSHIAYTNDDLQILELLPALDDILRQTATSDIRHFSGYALAY